MTDQDPFAHVRMKAAQLGIFETPVFHGQFTDAGALIEDLRAAIERRRATVPGVGRSNVGGWHSATDMLDWGGAAATRLATLTVNAAKRMSNFGTLDTATLDWAVKMWANVSPPGTLNMSHAHPGVLWAAVFYLDLGTPSGDEEMGGELFFEDPRFPMPLMRMPGFRMIGIDGQPQVNERRWPTRAGDLVLFPAWLRHGVRPYNGHGDRMSVAMNIDIRA